MSRDGRKRKKYYQNKGLKKTNRKLKIFSKGTVTTEANDILDSSRKYKRRILENTKEEYLYS